MANTVKEVFTVEKKTQYGVRANGVSYSYGKFLKDKSLEEGDVVEAEIYTGGKGGKYINSFVRAVNGINAPSTQAMPPILPPSLPATSLGETPAPGGVAPVKKTQSKVVDSEKMTKADWSAKDRSIETQAVLKSVLESPAYAQLVVGKRRDEAFQIGSEMFTFFLSKFYEARDNA